MNIFKLKNVFIMGKHHDPEYKDFVAKLVLEEGLVARQVA